MTKQTYSKAVPIETAPRSVDTGSGRSGRGSGLVDFLKLDRGESAESSLPAFALIGLLDLDHDSQAQFFAGALALPVENIGLQ